MKRDNNRAGRGLTLAEAVIGIVIALMLLLVVLGAAGWVVWLIP